MRFRSRHVIAAVAVLAAASLAPLFAQQVHVANSANGRITVFDAAGVPTPFAGNTSMLVKPLGILLDLNGRLVVCDNQRGHIYRYEANGSGPLLLADDLQRPDGPSYGPGGDLFFVSSPDGATSSKNRGVYALPGGIGPAVRIAVVQESRLLRDTAVAPTGPYAGHLLVLSSKPAFIARFSQGGAGAWTREADFAALPAEATGMAFTTSGDLLISGIEGKIFRYDAAGNRLADFAAGLGTGPTRIAVGADGIVYVTNRNDPALYRFDASGNRLPDFRGGLQSPAGVAVPDLTPTPVGRNVTVTPIPGVTVTYDNVTEAGFTSGVRTNQSVETRVTPCGNVIPGFALPPAGDDFFSVVNLDTTAGYTDSILVELMHPDGSSRGFHAACPPDAFGFEDFTVLAVPGDPRTRVPQFSEFVVVTDTRPNAEVIAYKLGRLQGTVGPDSPAASHIDETTLQTLRWYVSQAAYSIAEGNHAGAIEHLQALKAFVRQNSGATIPNSESSPGGNIAGQIESLAATLIFSLSI